MKQASAGRRVAWIIATRNSHKVEEIRAILGGKFNYLTLKDFSDPPSVVEDAPDFAGNATKKAVELSQWIAARIESVPAEIRDEEAWVLADDSGLEVDALNGAPGVHSARFAGLDSGNAAKAGNSKDLENNAKLLRLLRDVPLEKRTARFRCVIAVTPVVEEPRNSSNVCLSNEAELRTQLFDGTCEGQIALEPSGKGGFGYDPLFIPNGFTESFAELGEEVKNRLSHRAKALEKLREAFVSG